MGAMKNARKRRERRLNEKDQALLSEMHRARLGRDQTVQLANMRRPGGYYGAPFPDEVEKDQTVYVDGRGQRVDITPENAGQVSRYTAGRPAKVHTKYISSDSTPSTVATAPTGDESRKIRDVRASDVYHRNAITPTRPAKPVKGPQVRQWGISIGATSAA